MIARTTRRAAHRSDQSANDEQVRPSCATCNWSGAKQRKPHYGRLSPPDLAERSALLATSTHQQQRRRELARHSSLTTTEHQRDVEVTPLDTQSIPSAMLHDALAIAVDLRQRLAVRAKLCTYVRTNVRTWMYVSFRVRSMWQSIQLTSSGFRPLHACYAPSSPAVRALRLPARFCFMLVRRWPPNNTWKKL